MKWWVFAVLSLGAAGQILSCFSELNTLDCWGSDLSAAYKCLKSNSTQLSAACTSYVRGMESCVVAIDDVCPSLDNSLPECLWAHLGRVGPACKGSAFFTELALKFQGTMEGLGLDLLPCVADISIHNCGGTSVTTTIDCLIHNMLTISPPCKAIIAGAETCFADIKQCTTTPCIWENRNRLSAECATSPFFPCLLALSHSAEAVAATVTNLAGPLVPSGPVSFPFPTEVATKCAAELQECMSLESNFAAAVGCVLRKAGQITASCASMLGGASKCYTEVAARCQERGVASNLAWVAAHPNEITAACRSSQFYSQLSPTGALRSLLSCGVDAVRHGCANWDDLTGAASTLQCLLDHKDELSGQCSAFVYGMAQCFHDVERMCDTSVLDPATQLAFVATHLDSFSIECQASQLLRTAQAVVAALLPGLGQSQAVACSADLLAHSNCLSVPTTQVSACLRQTTNTTGVVLSGPCDAYLHDVEQCIVSAQAFCDTNPSPRCLWVHRAELGSQCLNSGVLSDLLAPLQQPQPGHPPLPVPDPLPTPEERNLTWACGLDLQIFRCGCPMTTTAQEQLKCLMAHSADLTGRCQAYFEGREVCLRDIRTLGCPAAVLNTPFAIRENLCVWAVRDLVSPACRSSPFFANFLFPVFNGTLPAEDTSSNPTNPGTDTDFAEPCRFATSSFCSNVPINGDPSNPNVRKCLALNLGSLDPVCQMWTSGRDVCLADAERICPGSPTPFVCLQTHMGSVSPACAKSVFFQSLLAWTINHLNTTKPETAPAQALDVPVGRTCHRRRVIAAVIIAALCLSSAVVLLLVFRRRCLKTGKRRSQAKSVKTLDAPAIVMGVPTYAIKAEPVEDPQKPKWMPDQAVQL